MDRCVMSHFTIPRHPSHPLSPLVNPWTPWSTIPDFLLVPCAIQPTSMQSTPCYMSHSHTGHITPFPSGPLAPSPAIYRYPLALLGFPRPFHHGPCMMCVSVTITCNM